jgi:hypothetical protein
MIEGYYKHKRETDPYSPNEPLRIFVDKPSIFSHKLKYNILATGKEYKISEAELKSDWVRVI